MIYRRDSRGESTMHTENTALDDCCDGQIVEYLIEVIPDIMVTVFLANLVIKAVQKGDISGLVIPSQQYHLVGIFEFI